MRAIARGGALVLLALAVAWAATALAIDAPAPFSAVLPVAVAITGVLGLFGLRPFRRKVLVLLALFCSVLLWWLSLDPRNDRVWLPDVARPPRASLAGDVLTVENVRDFRYRADGDYEERWESRRYDLSRLEGVDLFLSYWGSPWIAHTIVSFQFEDAAPLAISIETRKEEGEEYSALLGFFRRFELYYVAADERDVVGVRTRFRGEDTFLYRIQMPSALARALLLDYAADMNRLAAEPRWYNAATTNCTTVIRERLQRVAGARPWDWRILLNGRLDELMYEQGRIDRSRPFPELRSASAISARARNAEGAPDFSRRIREGLPPRPGPPTEAGSGLAAGARRS